MTDEIEAVARAICYTSGCSAPICLRSGTCKASLDRLEQEGTMLQAQAAIAALDKHRAERGGGLQRFEIAHIYNEEWQNPNGEWVRYDQAAAAIATLRAQLARAEERGVRLGIDAAAGALESDAKLCDCYARSESECSCGAWSDYKTVPMERAVDVVRALSPAAIIRANAEKLDLPEGDA